MENTMPIFPNIVYKCLFTFKGGYAIEIDTLHWYGSWFTDLPLISLVCVSCPKVTPCSGAYLRVGA